MCNIQQAVEVAGKLAVRKVEMSGYTDHIRKHGYIIRLTFGEGADERKFEFRVYDLPGKIQTRGVDPDRFEGRKIRICKKKEDSGGTIRFIAPFVGALEFSGLTLAVDRIELISPASITLSPLNTKNISMNEHLRARTGRKFSPQSRAYGC